MPLLKPSLRLASNKVVKPNALKQAVRQQLAARASGRELPTIPECPSPTCECAEMPPNLDIETEKKLNGTMPAHSEHVIICTGQADWKSRIEDEKDTAPWGEVVSSMKTLLGPKGRLHDPYRNIIVSTCSFENTPGQPPSALIFPSFTHISQVQPTESSIANFLESFVLTNPQQSTEPQPSQKKSPTDLIKEKSSRRQGLATPISTPTILICSHNTRDSRCGILGPLLHQEFSQYINKRHTSRNRITSELIDDPQWDDTETDGETTATPSTFASHPQFHAHTVNPNQARDNNAARPINVGMISHIGGHKWAGNVIVYIPPDYRVNPVNQTRPRRPTAQDDSTRGPVLRDHGNIENETSSDDQGDGFVSPLAGKGIWYGRVQPKHVEGIVEQTIGRGKIIQSLFRGGVNGNGSVIRL